MKTNYARLIVLTFIILFVKSFLNAQTPPDETYTQNPFGGNLVLSSAYCEPYETYYYEEDNYTEWYYDWNYVWRIEVPQNTPIKFEYTKYTYDYFEIYTNNQNGYRQFAYDYSTGTKSVILFSSDGYIWVRASTCGWGEPPTGNVFNLNFAIESNFSMTNGSYNNGNMIVDGKLGIGTVMPSEQLEVIGNAKITNKFAIGTSPHSTSKFSLFNDTEYTSQSICNYKNTTNSTYGINITTNNYPGYTYGIYSSVYGQTGKKWAGYFKGGDVEVAGGGNIFLNSENSVITAMDDNLGIVKKYGQSPVWAVGSGYAHRFGKWSTPTLKCNIGTGTFTEQMRIDNNGNVGVGTITPQAGLHVTKVYTIGSANVTAILGNDYNHWTYFGGTTGGRIRGSNEGYLVVESNPNGLGDKSLYLNHDTPGNILMANGGGKVGIGVSTITTDALLTVNGIIHAKEVKVTLEGLADYVFSPDYSLMPLHKVEAFVKTNKHLPEIPSAAEVKEKGLSMGEMQNKLLQKIEELTLYVIEQQKQIEKQSAKIEELETKVK